MATNVRRKARTDRSVQTLARDTDIIHVPASAPRKRRTMADEAEEVRRRIEHLECVITTAPAEHAARRVAMRDVVPPSDELMVRRKPAKPRRRPMQVEARSRHRSMGLLVQSVVLAVIIAGVAGWLNQRFHFLHM